MSEVRLLSEEEERQQVHEWNATERDYPREEGLATLFEAEVARVTLTRAAILSARTVLITIAGQEKRELLEQAIADGHSSKLPIGRVLAEAEQPIDIHWCP